MGVTHIILLLISIPCSKANTVVEVDLSLTSLLGSCFVNVVTIGASEHTLKAGEDFQDLLTNLHHSAIPLVFGTTNRGVFHKSFTARFLSCLIQIYAFDETIVGPNNNIIQTQTEYIKSLQEVKFTVLNPKYIILTLIQQEQCNMKLKILDSIHGAALSFSATSKIIALCFKGWNISGISIPCLHCGPHDSINLPPRVMINNPEIIEKVWNTLYTNLLGKRISTNLPFFDKSFKPEYLDPKICMLGIHGVHLSPAICTLKTLAVFLNFTMGPGTKPGTLQTVQTVSNIYSNVFFSSISSRELQNPDRIYSSANTVEFISFSFMVVIDQQLWNLAAYSRPIDFYSWILFLIFLLLSSLVYHFISCFAMSSSWFGCNKVLKSLWLFIAIIFEQSQNRLRLVSKRSFSSPAVILLGTYIVSISVLCCVYKSCIVSYLISTPIPNNIPNSIVEIVKSREYLVITHDALYQEKGPKISTLKATILNELIDNIQKPEYYVELSKKLVFVDARNPDLIGCIIKEESCQSYINGHANYTLMTLPTNRLIIIGSTSQLRRLKTILETETQSYLYFSGEIDMFNSRIPWFIYRNIFEPIINSAIEHLQQSGIYERWRNSYEKQVTEEELLQFHYSHLFKNATNNTEYIVLEPKDFSKIFRRTLHGTQNMNTLTIKAFLLVVALLFLGIVMSLGIFLVEELCFATCCILKRQIKIHNEKKRFEKWRKIGYIE